AQADQPQGQADQPQDQAAQPRARADRAPAGAADRPLRADARRNRARLLTVAEQVIADRGAGVSTEEIARTAGVGIGTLFRHFPTKEDLLTAVYAERLRGVADKAAELADAQDAGAALRGLLTYVVGRSAVKNTLVAALAAAGVDPEDDETGAAKRRYTTVLAGLLDRAQRAGAVRADVGLPELHALIVGASRTAELTPDPTVRARALAVVLDGLRPPPP
ncbi:TetR/AcrR family transcriptional regulator, partial [Plantactinospora siamensis]